MFIAIVHRIKQNNCACWFCSGFYGLFWHANDRGGGQIKIYIIAIYTPEHLIFSILFLFFCFVLHSGVTMTRESTFRRLVERVHYPASGI